MQNLEGFGDHPKFSKNIEHLSQIGPHQGGSGAREGAFALTLSSSRSFFNAGNLEKGVLKRRSPVPFQTCTITPSCLWKQVKGIHSMHGLSAWRLSREVIW